jgi:hypothetical protein
MRVGEAKARIFRVLQYAALLTAPSVLLTFVKVYGGRWYWVLLSIPFILLAWWIDPKIQEGEISYSNKSNEEWIQHQKNIEEILRLLRSRETK